MPEIRPIKELSNAQAIAQLCHSVSEPVFLTKNGYQDLVIMSSEEYERRCAREELYAKLLEAEEDEEKGNILREEEVFSQMRAKYGY